MKTRTKIGACAIGLLLAFANNAVLCAADQNPAVDSAQKALNDSETAKARKGWADSQKRLNDPAIQIKEATDLEETVYGPLIDELLDVSPEVKQVVLDNLVQRGEAHRDVLKLLNKEHIGDKASRNAEIARASEKSDNDLKKAVDGKTYAKIKQWIAVDHELVLVTYNDAKLCEFQGCPLTAAQRVALASAYHDLMEPKNSGAKDRFTRPLSPLGLTVYEEEMLTSLQGTLSDGQLFMVRNRLVDIQRRSRQ